jgi:hypothetical protein
LQRVTPHWRKSSYSGEGANCVEAGTLPGAILVRDTTDRDGGTLTITPGAWQAFAGSLK